MTCGMGARKSDMFLMGLFSLLDVIMSRPLNEILQEITIEEDVQAALSGEPGILRTILELIIAIEKAEWDQVTALAQKLQADEKSLNDAYMNAVKWAQEIYTL